MLNSAQEDYLESKRTQTFNSLQSGRLEIQELGKSSRLNKSSITSFVATGTQHRNSDVHTKITKSQQMYTALISYDSYTLPVR